MSTRTFAAPERVPVSVAPPAPAFIVVLLCLTALAARRVGTWGPVVTIAIGAAALLVPVRREASRGSRVGPLLVGVAAFVVARAAMPTVGPPLSVSLFAGGVAAAFAEEALFRRTLYATLERRGTGLAILAGALLFALVHVPGYGWPTFGLNLAAGALLGWQRAASGAWTVPAATHAVANLLQYL